MFYDSISLFGVRYFWEYVWKIIPKKVGSDAMKIIMLVKLHGTFNASTTKVCHSFDVQVQPNRTLIKSKSQKKFWKIVLFCRKLHLRNHSWSETNFESKCGTLFRIELSFTFSCVIKSSPSEIKSILIKGGGFYLAKTF